MKLSRRISDRYIGAALALLAMALLVLFVAYALHEVNKPVGTYENGYRVDKEPIAWRFPVFGQFEKCYWHADIIGDPRVPGPNGYWMKGFLVLDSADLQTLRAQYQWKDVESGWKPSMDTAILKVQSFHWTRSEGFESYVNHLHDYGGAFYLDLENGIVFFDVDCC